jgi:hypothetical protein
MARILTLWLVVALVCGLGFGGLVAAVRVRQVVVRSPDPTVAQEVRARLEVPEWTNLITSRLSRLADQAEACPRVKRADFAREFPGRLVITVEPRQPLLVWQKGTEFMLVDREGVCLYWTNQPDKCLLRVKGAGLQARVGQRLSGEWFERARMVAEALADAQQHQPWILDVSRPQELAVVTGSGARGILGLTTDLARRARLFAEVLSQYEKRGQAIGLMELRTDPPIIWLEGQRPDRAAPTPKVTSGADDRAEASDA